MKEQKKEERVDGSSSVTDQQSEKKKKEQKGNRKMIFFGRKYSNVKNTKEKKRASRSRLDFDLLVPEVQNP